MFRITLFDEKKHASLVVPLTELLHAAYAPLAAEGLHYVASHQPPQTTLDRLTEGTGWIFHYGSELAGTISLYEGARKKSSCDYYRQPGIFLSDFVGDVPWQDQQIIRPPLSQHRWR